MNNEQKIISFTCGAHFFTHFFELLFPALAIPLSLSLNVELTDVLKLGFLMYLLYGLAALPWGFFADRFGNRTSLVIFFLGIGTGSILTSFSDSPMSIMISLSLIGFFSSIYHPAGMGLISIGIRNRGTALGINGVAGNLGFVAAPFAGGFLNWVAGWQATYCIVGCICIVAGVLMIFVDIDETPIEEPAARRGAAVQNDNMRYFIILCIVMTLSGIAYRINNVVLPSYFELKASFLWDFFKQFHLSNVAGVKTMAATLLASSIYIVSSVGQYIGGKLADRYDLRRLYFLFYALSLPFVVVMALVDERLLVLATALYVFFALGMQPIENSLVAHYTPAKWRSTGFGIKFILVFGVGAFAVYLVGWIKDLWNIETVYLFSAGIILLILLFIMFLIWISRGVDCRNRAVVTGPPETAVVVK